MNETRTRSRLDQHRAPIYEALYNLCHPVSVIREAEELAGSWYISVIRTSRAALADESKLIASMKFCLS